LDEEDEAVPTDADSDEAAEYVGSSTVGSVGAGEGLDGDGRVDEDVDSIALRRPKRARKA
jgi:hypothetical protein